MGGQGSGRPPGVKALIERTMPKVEFNNSGNSFLLPNSSNIQQAATKSDSSNKPPLKIDHIAEQTTGHTIITDNVMKTTADQSSADTEYYANVLYNTDATPPAANTVPIGTIYIQYTA